MSTFSFIAEQLCCCFAI